MKKMHFMHVSDLAIPHIGGVEYVVYKYSKMQVEEGHRADVVTTLLPNTERREEREGVNYYRIPKFSMPVSSMRMIKKREPDIVHTHSYLSSFSLSFLWKINRNIPILRHIHDVYINKLEEYTGWKGSRLYASIERYTITRDYTAYIVPSKYTRSRLVEMGLDERRIHVVAPGVDIEKFGRGDGNYLRRKYSIPKDRKIIGFVGRISTGKGAHYLIEATRNVDAHVVLVGPNPDPRTSGIRGIKDDLLKRVKEYGMEGRVIFAGVVKDEELPLYYDSFDIFCLPSISEGFGMSIAEALAAGKPVVSFNTTAIPEIVRDGFNGLLAEPRNVGDLKEKIERLLTDMELYERLKKNTRKSVEKFTWRNSYDALMKVYEIYLAKN